MERVDFLFKKFESLWTVYEIMCHVNLYVYVDINKIEINKIICDMCANTFHFFLKTALMRKKNKNITGVQGHVILFDIIKLIVFGSGTT